MAVRHAFTIEEWHRMGETGLFGDEARMELLDGEVIEMSPIGSAHGGCVNYLTRALLAAAGDRGRAGVREYWIVDLAGDQILVMRTPGAGGYREVGACQRGERLGIKALAGVELWVSDILGPKAQA